MTLIRVVDVETTGLDDPCDMVEIGWTDIRGTTKSGWVIESGPYSEIVKPGVPISFPAMAVHHISEQDVIEGITPDEARMIIDGADIYCAHNAAFEGRFLGSDRQWLCTFKSARTFWPDLQGHGNGSIRYELGLCLNDERCLPAHRAGPDTWVTAHILLDLLQEHDFDELIEISKRPVLLRKLGFGEHGDKPLPDVPWDYLDWIVNKSKMPSDPRREDAVHTAKHELARRSGKQPALQGHQDNQPKQTNLLDQQQTEQPAKTEQAKGGPLARRAAILCADHGFWTFSETQSAEEAADWLRDLCGIKSRADLDHDQRAAQEYEKIDGRYRRWLQGYDD